jgi:hypothetical protein
LNVTAVPRIWQISDRSLTKKEGLNKKRKAAREAKTRPHARKAPDLKEKEQIFIFTSEPDWILTL